MKKIACVFILAAMMVSFGCTTGQSYKLEGYNFSSICSVAVVDVVGCVGGEAAKNQIADYFNMELLKKGYSPIERSQVQSIFEGTKVPDE